MSSALVFCLAFAAMEGVSYADAPLGDARRRLRLAPKPPRAAAGRFERNDRFPLCFSVVGVALFLLASRGPRGCGGSPPG